jgi:methylenetetrahydrofolate dehydrogenase (NADP+) / methenyltetrahydrofolate cyclohydrolase
MKKIILKYKKYKNFGLLNLINQSFGTIINGKEISKIIRNEIAKEVQQIKLETNKVPGLAVVMVGERKDSQIYFDQKKKFSKLVGFNSFDITLPENVEEEKLIEVIQNYNNDDNVHGILVQLPRNILFYF